MLISFLLLHNMMCFMIDVLAEKPLVALVIVDIIKI